MANYGRLGGAGISGYYHGRAMREDAEDRETEREWLQNRRDRELRREQFLDPAEEEMTGIGIESARGRLADEEFSRPLRRRALERGDERADMEQEDYEFRRPLDRRALERGDRMGDMQVDDYEFRRPYDRRAVRRGDEAGDLALREGRRRDRVGEMETRSTERFFSMDERLEQGRNALGIVSMTGDPKPMADWYNNLYDDDQDVEIERVGEDEYVFRHSSGIVKKVTKQQLIDSFEEHILKNADPAMLGGSAAGGYRGAGRPGYGGGTRMPSAYIQQIDRMTQDFIRAGVPPLEAAMRAHAEASYKARTSPEEAVMDFESMMIEKLLPDMTYMGADEREKAIMQAEQQASEMARRYAQRHYGSDSRDAGAGGDAEGGAGAAPDISRIPEQAKAFLRDNENLKAEFDAKYGAGAAEAVLNGE